MRAAAGTAGSRWEEDREHQRREQRAQPPPGRARGPEAGQPQERSAARSARRLLAAPSAPACGKPALGSPFRREGFEKTVGQRIGQIQAPTAELGKRGAGAAELLVAAVELLDAVSIGEGDVGADLSALLAAVEGAGSMGLAAGTLAGRFSATTRLGDIGPADERAALAEDCLEVLGALLLGMAQGLAELGRVLGSGVLHLTYLYYHNMSEIQDPPALVICLSPDPPLPKTAQDLLDRCGAPANPPAHAKLAGDRSERRSGAPARTPWSRTNCSGRTQ